MSAAPSETEHGEEEKLFQEHLEESERTKNGMQ